MKKLTYKELVKENGKFVFWVIIFIAIAGVAIPEIITIPVGWIINSNITYETYSYNFGSNSGTQFTYYIQLIGENNLREFGFYIYIIAVIFYVFILGIGSILLKYIEGDRNIEKKLLVLLAPFILTLLLFKLDSSHLLLKFLVSVY